jgi:hypothetical protein
MLSKAKVLFKILKRTLKSLSELFLHVFREDNMLTFGKKETADQKTSFEMSLVKFVFNFFSQFYRFEPSHCLYFNVVHVKDKTKFA